ncbi:MAG: hypothetical protein LBM70_07620 [Victivallales bacterium]|jgi:hypothetical protein|nr:hypothetical protein [Victivallales bacterium]
MNFFTKKRLIAIAMMLVIVGGIAFWYFNRDSDEKKIRQTIQTLCDIASKRANENPALSLINANAADKVFASKCKIDFRHEMFSGSYTPTELTSILLRSKRVLKSCEIDIRDVSIMLTSRERASAVFTGLLDAITTDGKVVSEVRDLYCTLQKIDDSWLIDSMSVRDILEK